MCWRRYRIQPSRTAVDGSPANCADRDSVASSGVFLRTATHNCAVQVRGHIRVLGVDVVSKKNRSFLVVSLFPLVLLGSLFAVVQAREGKTPAIKQTLWSDPATWPDRQVPRAGDMVTIEKGKDVLLDVSPPSLHGLHIEGKLSFSDKADIALTTEWIMVHGELEIGTEAKPHTHKATITLTDNVPGEEL